VKFNVRVKAFLTALLFAAVCAPPAGALPDKHQDESAKAIAHLLEAHYHNAQSLRAVFLERYSEGPRSSRVESGTVYFRRPGRMRWEYESPEKKLFISDGKTVWFYVPADHSVTRSPVKSSSDWRTPLSLLTGKAELGRMCGTIQLLPVTGLAADRALLRCLPKGQKKVDAKPAPNSADDSTELPGAAEFTEVLLEVGATSGELFRVQIRQPGGLELEYTFGDWQEGIAL